MDADKSVTGNFQPVMVLSMQSPQQNNYICPLKENEELTVATVNIFVDGVDWQLDEITFVAEDEVKSDYTEAWIEYNKIKFKGTLTTNASGYITPPGFNPSVLIKEGNTLSIRLFYKFNYPSAIAGKVCPFCSY